MARDWSALDGLVKHHYVTGEYGNAHLLVSKLLYGDMQAHRPPPLPDWADPRPLGYLMGIRIVVDGSLPDGEWRLVDDATSDVLFIWRRVE